MGGDAGPVCCLVVGWSGPCELPYICFFQFGEGDAERVQQKLHERRMAAAPVVEA